MTIAGVTFEGSHRDHLTITIHEFSDEFKSAIRESLSSICNGPRKSLRDSELYGYRATLREFLYRLAQKDDNTKKGMIGELLTHLLLIHGRAAVSSLNPYFNLEERNVKKGFDLVVRDNETGETLLTEVKSGDCDDADETSMIKANSLFSIASRDMLEKLSKPRHALWQNAINGAQAAMPHGKLKDQIEEVLEKMNRRAIKSEDTPADHHVILVAVPYCGRVPYGTSLQVSEALLRHRRKPKFASVGMICIQKKAYKMVVDFLIQESLDG